MPKKSFDTVYKKYGGKRTTNRKMGLLEKIKKVILSPSEFFEVVKHEAGVRDAFKYLAILSLVNLVVGIARYFLSIPSLSPLGNLISLLPSVGNLANLVGIMTPIGIYIVSLIISFISAGFIHIFAKLLKGKGDYSATYKTLVYASTPYLLLGWIPLVGVIIGLYSFYLGLKGISKLHEMSIIRAFIVLFVLPFITILIISFIFGLVAMYFFLSFISKTGSSLGPLISLYDSSCSNGVISVSIQNLGNSRISISDLKFYLNESETSVRGCYGVIEPTSTITCLIDSEKSGSLNLKVVGPSNTARSVVYCP